MVGICLKYTNMKSERGAEYTKQERAGPAQPAQPAQPDRTHQMCISKTDDMLNTWFKKQTSPPPFAYFKTYTKNEIVKAGPAQPGHPD